MNDTCTQLHTMRAVFLLRRFTRTKRRAKGASEAVILLKQKATLAITRPPPPQCRLLPHAPAWLLRHRHRWSKRGCPQTRASSSHCSQTQRPDPGHVLRQVEKNWATTSIHKTHYDATSPNHIMIYVENALHDDIVNPTCTHTHLQWVKRTRVDVWSSTKWCGVSWWWQDSTWDRSAKILD